MSGLVSGLQNHVRRFESARYLGSTAIAVFFYLLNTMADNFLEKKMEQHKVRAASGPSPKVAKSSLSALLDKLPATTMFDNYVVREDQLRRMVSSAAKVAVNHLFRFKVITGDDALRLRLSDAAYPKANAYVAVCFPYLADSSLYISLGRVVEVMRLQAAEIGLSAVVLDRFDASSLARDFEIPVAPLALLAVGRSCELSLTFDSAFSEMSVNDLFL